MSSSNTAEPLGGSGAQGTPPILVLGLGNPILGDDGVGWRVVDEAERRWKTAAAGRAPRARAWAGVDGPDLVDGVEFDRFSLGGIALMERLAGYRQAILVDAIQTRGGVPGTVYRLGLDELPTLHADSVHDASLKAALELGRRLGASLPEEPVIFAVEAANVYDFGEALTPAVAAAVGRAAEAVLDEISSIEV